jgi:chemotaxis protein MotB
MTVPNEGLRVELLESAKGAFFDMGSPELNTDGRDLVIKLAQELGKLPNKIAIEGHTTRSPLRATKFTVTGNCPRTARTQRDASCK